MKFMWVGLHYAAVSRIIKATENGNVKWQDVTPLLVKTGDGKFIQKCKKT